MAWERRYNRTYYYRSKQVGGRIVHEYLGRGPRAEQAALEASRRRERRRAQAAAFRAEQARWQALEAPSLELTRQTDLLTRAALLVAGYHQHSLGEWRRKRPARANPEPP
jgi:hypothetical protein